MVGHNISLEPEFVITAALWLLEQRETELGLSPEQRSLVRDVRKRGRNKMHANNCRRRQMDQLADLQVIDLTNLLEYMYIHGPLGLESKYKHKSFLEED